MYVALGFLALSQRPVQPVICFHLNISIVSTGGKGPVGTLDISDTAYSSKDHFHFLEVQPLE